MPDTYTIRQDDMPPKMRFLLDQYPRFDARLEVLEKDHTDLDQILDDCTRHANHLASSVQGVNGPA